MEYDPDEQEGQRRSLRTKKKGRQSMLIAHFGENDEDDDFDPTEGDADLNSNRRLRSMYRNNENKNEGETLEKAITIETDS